MTSAELSFSRVLDSGELSATADSIEALQLASGMIPWFEGGHSDPWNHVEAAMALSVAGRHEAAEAAYRWLAETQLANGAWHSYTAGDGSVKDARLDTNICAYVATGLWHQVLCSGTTELLGSLWTVVEKAVAFVLSWQRPGGELVWSVDPDGTPGRYALLTGSCSAYLSLRCAVACAEALGLERPDWELAAGRLRHAIACRPGSFEPKDRFAMDWYYPVLSGALPPGEGSARLDRRWPDLVMEGRGVRCVTDRPWVTTAETAECALSLLSVGREAEAELLLSWVQCQREPDGSYTTGLVYPGSAGGGPPDGAPPGGRPDGAPPGGRPDGAPPGGRPDSMPPEEAVTFPPGETTSYSAAAMILAVDCLNRGSRASGLFLGESLPPGLDLEEDPAARLPLSGSGAVPLSGSGAVPLSGSGAGGPLPEDLEAAVPELRLLPEGA